jgi:simple sugar transport system substrate-binding protein
MEILKDALEGSIQYGKAQTVGVKEGYLGFIFDDPAYKNNLPADIREKFEIFYNDLKEGKIKYTIPPL